MDNIENIEINYTLSAKNYSVVINTKDLSMYKNGIRKQISKGALVRLLSFFKSWKNEYLSSKDLDANSFEVKIKTDKELIVYKGKGDYPKNYNGFIRFISNI